ncbi:hypothetical protein GQ607_011877 [Colletotrichum asianum]|uniref:Uncharacterized protein n=1 Tax=Colletotrichum asianum TaxID=702518 RepID=A0A8H3W7Q1_9PEZI|nr:hypothetical protein GQ607_011877 [Colletotrichum asianum]
MEVAKTGSMKREGTGAHGEVPSPPHGAFPPLDAGHRNAKSEPVGKWGHQAGNTEHQKK